MGRLLQGRFETRGEMWTWVLVGVLLSGALAVMAVLHMPEAMEFHPLRTCVSKVGSFDAEYNPTGYRWFSAALMVLALLMAPLVLYRHRRMSAALGASWRMRILTALFLIGVAGYFITGLIPMGRPKLIGNLTWDNIHDVAAKITFICFGSGLLIEGLVVLLKHRRSDGTLLPFRTLILPYVWMTVLGTCAVYFLLAWDIKRANDPTLRWTGEGLYAFALWEWLLFLSGPLIVPWIALAWMHADKPRDSVPDPTDASLQG